MAASRTASASRTTSFVDALAFEQMSLGGPAPAGGIAAVGTVQKAHETERVTKASESEKEGGGHGSKTAAGRPLEQLLSRLRHSRC